MITQIFSDSDFNALPEKGVEAQKIRALLHAYGAGYDFCRFFRQNESAFLAVLDGNGALCCGAQTDFAELSCFLLLHGVSELFCSETAADNLCRFGGFRRTDVNLMRFSGTGEPCEFEHTPSLSEVYKILRTGFAIDFEPWYLDMSHRVRHGVSRFAVREGACLCVQHNIGGEALLSQVATLPELRGQKRATTLIKAVCAELSPSEVFVICEDSLLPFYKKIGFEFSEQKAVLTR